MVTFCHLVVTLGGTLGDRFTEMEEEKQKQREEQARREKEAGEGGGERKQKKEKKDKVWFYLSPMDSVRRGSVARIHSDSAAK